MPRPRNVHHVEIVLLDHSIEMHPDEVLSWIRSPMAEQPALDVLGLQRFFEQRVVAQVDHPDAQVVARAPVSVDKLEFLIGERFWHEWYLRLASIKFSHCRRFDGRRCK